MKLGKAGTFAGTLNLTATLAAGGPALADGDDSKDIVGTSGDVTIRGTTKSDYALVGTKDNDIDVFYCGPGKDRIDYLLKRVDPRDEFNGCETITTMLPS